MSTTPSPIGNVAGRAVVPALLAAILLAQLWLHGPWIIDDAGITFAYARNFAAGHGWVAQPGVPPVEGFSNLLWALLLLPFLWLGAFDPVWTPKLLGLGCAFGALLLVRRAVRQTHPRQRRWGDVGLCLLAAHPSFAVWSLSGLENGLYALLTAALLHATATTAGRGAPTAAASVVAGALAALAAATRPDGAVLAAWWPATVLLCASGPPARRLGPAAAAALVTVAGIGVVTLWRWTTFGEVVPNTFHAKVGDSWRQLGTAAALGAALLAAQLWRWRTRLGPWPAGTLHAAAVVLVCAVVRPGVVRDLGGDVGIALVAAAFGLAGRHPRTTTAPWALGTILALFVYESLPPDWMGLHRFGTPFLVVALPWVAVELGAARAGLTGVARRGLAAAALAAALLVAARAVDRTLGFRAAPTVPMAAVERRHLVLAGWADELGMTDATVMVPDVGGALWANRIRTLDLAGLCDAEVARLRSSPPLLARLVLEERRPTFLEFHGSWCLHSGLADAPELHRDYVAIAEWSEPAASREAGRELRAGVYVRREHAPDAEVLRRWRREWR